MTATERQAARELPPHEREYTLNLAYHLREFLIFALDRWTEQGLNRGEAVCIRQALLSDEGHEPLFDASKRETDALRQAVDDKEGLLVAAEKRVDALELQLRKMANEADSFLSMADPETHGHTNIAVLRHRIDESRLLILAALAAKGKPVQEVQG